MATEETQTFLAAAETFADLAGRLDPTTLPGPGLGEWDLRALVGHTSRSLITVLTYLDQPATEERVTSPEEYYRLAAQLKIDPAAIVARGRDAGAYLGDDPGDAVRGLAEQVRKRLAAADPDALITTIAGGMRLRAYLPTRTFELVVHGFDIAAATELPLEFATEVLIEATQLAVRIGVAGGQAPALLAAMTGRRPLPPGFSVVF